MNENEMYRILLNEIGFEWTKKKKIMIANDELFVNKNTGDITVGKKLSNKITILLKKLLKSNYRWYRKCCI